MNEKLKIIKNFVQSIILRTIEQKVERWSDCRTLPSPIHTEIESNQKHVDIAYNLLLQNVSQTVSAPMYVQENGEQRMAK